MGRCIRLLLRWFGAGAAMGFAVSLVLSIPPMFFPLNRGPHMGLPPDMTVKKRMVLFLRRERGRQARAVAGAGTGSRHVQFVRILHGNLWTGVAVSYGMLAFCAGALPAAMRLAGRSDRRAAGWMQRLAARAFSRAPGFREAKPEDRFMLLLAYLPLAFLPQAFLLRTGFYLGKYSLLLYWRGAIGETLAGYGVLVGPHAVMEITALALLACIPLLVYLEVARFDAGEQGRRAASLARRALGLRRSACIFAAGAAFLTAAAVVETYASDKIYMRFDRVLLPEKAEQRTGAPGGSAG